MVERLRNHVAAGLAAACFVFAAFVGWQAVQPPVYKATAILVVPANGYLLEDAGNPLGVLLGMARSQEARERSRRLSGLDVNSKDPSLTFVAYPPLGQLRVMTTSTDAAAAKRLCGTGLEVAESLADSLNSRASEAKLNQIFGGLRQVDARIVSLLAGEPGMSQKALRGARGLYEDRLRKLEVREASLLAVVGQMSRGAAGVEAAGAGDVPPELAMGLRSELESLESQVYAFTLTEGEGAYSTKLAQAKVQALVDSLIKEVSIWLRVHVKNEPRVSELQARLIVLQWQKKLVAGFAKTHSPEELKLLAESAAAKNKDLLEIQIRPIPFFRLQEAMLDPVPLNKDWGKNLQYAAVLGMAAGVLAAWLMEVRKRAS